MMNRYVRFNPNQINNSAPENKNEQPKHLRGLVNIASTCYMNSIIQCFAHIEELILYFEKPKMVQLIEAPENREKLFPVFVELIINYYGILMILHLCIHIYLKKD
jgi:ubiquitin C-terminal hydrolase